MRGSRRPNAARLVVAACLLLVVACDRGATDRELADAADARRAADCAAAVDALLGVTQRYLDSIEGTSATSQAPSAESTPEATSTPDGASTPDDADPNADAEQLNDALSNIRAYAAGLGCDAETFQDDLSRGMQELSAGGPVARAVLLQLQADEAGGVAAGVLAPGDDVAAAVAAAPSGATVELGPGTHELSETLVLLRGVTLRGAGRDATVLQSPTPGGVVLVLTGEPTALQDLALAHVGPDQGSVVSGGPAATLSLTGARVVGARADSEGVGGVGILMAAGSGGQTGPVRRTTLQVTDTELLDNAVAGIVVAGEHRAELVRATVERNGQCGVCFLGTSDGGVRESRFADNAAGIVAGGDAKPSVQGSTITGGEVGLQVLDRAAPEVAGNTVTAARRAAMIWTDTAAGRVDANRCVDVEFGIVVGPGAMPFLAENDCRVARGQ